MALLSVNVRGVVLESQIQTDAFGKSRESTCPCHQKLSEDQKVPTQLDMTVTSVGAAKHARCQGGVLHYQ